MAAAFDRAGFDAVDVHMTRHRRRADRWRISGGSWPAADFRMATCWVRARAGPSPSCSTRAHAMSCGGSSRAATAHARCLQRLPDVHAARVIPGAEHWPRFVRNRSEQYEARLLWSRSSGQPFVAVRRHGGSMLPVVGGAWRGSRGIRGEMPCCALAGAGRCVSSTTRPRCERYPANPNGSARRNGRGVLHRRPRDDHDAAPGTGVSRRPELVASGHGWRRQRMDADLPERSRLAGLTQDRAPGSGVTFELESSAKYRRTIIACCRRPRRT